MEIKKLSNEEKNAIRFKAAATSVIESIFEEIPLVSQIYEFYDTTSSAVKDAEFENTFEQVKAYVEQNYKNIGLIKQELVENKKKIEKLEGKRIKRKADKKYRNLNNKINLNLDFIKQNNDFIDRDDNRGLVKKFVQQVRNYNNTKNNHKNKLTELKEKYKKEFNGEVGQKVFEQVEKYYESEKTFKIERENFNKQCKEVLGIEESKAQETINVLKEKIVKLHKTIEQGLKSKELFIEIASSFKDTESIIKHDNKINCEIKELENKKSELQSILNECKAKFEETTSMYADSATLMEDAISKKRMVVNGDKGERREEITNMMQQLGKLKSKVSDGADAFSKIKNDLEVQIEGIEQQIKKKEEQTVTYKKKMYEKSLKEINSIKSDIEIFARDKDIECTNVLLFSQKVEPLIEGYNNVKLYEENSKTSINNARDSIKKTYSGDSDSKIEEILELHKKTIEAKNENDRYEEWLNETLKNLKKQRTEYEEQRMSNLLSDVEDILEIEDQKVKDQEVDIQSGMPLLTSSVCDEKDLLERKKVTTCAAVEEQSEVIQELKYKIEQKDKQILEMQQQIQQIQQIMNALQTQSLFVLQQNTKDRSIGIDSQQNVGSNTNPLNDHGDLVENLSGAVSDINTKQAPSSIRQRIDFFNKKKVNSYKYK